MTSTELTEPVTVSCDEPGCSAGPDGGPWQITAPGNQVKMRLGSHKNRVHGIKGRSERKSKAQAREEQLRDRPALTVLSGAAEKVTGSGAPSATALENGLGEGLHLITVAVASVLVETDQDLEAITDAHESEAERKAMMAYLTLPQDTARGVMRPVAKAIQPTRLNRKYGRAVVDNVGLLGTAVDLGTYVMHLSRYLRVRVESNRQRAQQAQVYANVIAPYTAAPPPGGYVPDQGDTSQHGVVIGAEQIDALRRGSN